MIATRLFKLVKEDSCARIGAGLISRGGLFSSECTAQRISFDAVHVSAKIVESNQRGLSVFHAFSMFFHRSASIKRVYIAMPSTKMGDVA